MLATRRFTAGLVLAIVLMLPREGAAFWNWLHELSGPGPFVGFVVGCTANVRFDDFCSEFVVAGPSLVRRDPQRLQRFWWRVELNHAWSYRNVLDPQGRTVYWTSVDLLGEVRPVRGERVELILAAGPSLDVFFGDAFDSTVKFGLRVRPSMAVRLFEAADRDFALEVGPELRTLFPRLNQSDFGVTPGADLERAAWGVYVGLRITRP